MHACAYDTHELGILLFPKHFFFFFIPVPYLQFKQLMNLVVVQLAEITKKNGSFHFYPFRFDLVWFGGHIWQCSKLTPGPACRNHSWRYFGGNIRYRKLNMDWPYARQFALTPANPY